MQKRVSFVCALVLLLALAACGSGNNGPEIPPAGGGSTPSAGGAGNAPAASATLSGKIAFDGAMPADVKIQMGADPYCSKNAKDPMTEDYEGKDGGLQNVIIYVSSPVSYTFPTPTDAVTIDQHDCHYVPHVFTLMVGQKLTIKNSDETLHNIHAFSDINEQFNVGQAVKGMTNDHVFTKAEMPLPFKCDVHKWMSSFAGVFTHPYEAVSKEDGTYEIKLPPGSYEITAWHEKLGPQKQNIEVKDGANKLDFTFKASSAD